MRTTVNLEDQALDLAKERAHALHKTLGEYLAHATQVEAIWHGAATAAELARPERPAIRSFSGDGLAPGIDAGKNPWHWEDDEPDERGLFRA